MPHYLREWIFPAILFLIGLFIPIDETGFGGPGVYIAKFFIGIGCALVGMFFQTIFSYVIVSAIRGRMGFLKGEKRHLSVILMLAAEVVKADGKIDDREIKVIKERLSKDFKEERVEGYMKEFQLYLDIDESLSEMCKIVHNDFNESAKAHLMYLLIHLATADGLLSDSELEIIRKIAKYSRIKSATYFHVFKTFEFKREQNFRQKSQQQSGQRKSRPSVTELRKAYELIGVAENATMDEIKKAYRKLAKIHHPDKVSHLGEEHQNIAKEKFQIIVDAYDTIKEKRGV